MRNITILLILLRDRIKDSQFIGYGLCHEVWLMRLDCPITDEEFAILRAFIDNNRPKRGKHFHIEMSRSPYYWPESYVKPRLDWLNDKIKNFKNPKI